jgi:isopenicillin N synthase-like dioxygenase
MRAAEREVDLAWQALCHWQKQTEQARSRAWLKHHQENGWPDIPGYKKRMEEAYAYHS